MLTLGHVGPLSVEGNHMQIRLWNLGPNQAEVETNDRRIFYTYHTPAAVMFKATRMIYFSDERHSNTSTRHLGAWLDRFSEDMQVRVNQETLNTFAFYPKELK